MMLRERGREKRGGINRGRERGWGNKGLCKWGEIEKAIVYQIFTKIRLDIMVTRDSEVENPHSIFSKNTKQNPKIKLIQKSPTLY